MQKIDLHGAKIYIEMLQVTQALYTAHVDLKAFGITLNKYEILFHIISQDVKYFNMK